MQEVGEIWKAQRKLCLSRTRTQSLAPETPARCPSHKKAAVPSVGQAILSYTSRGAVPLTKVAPTKFIFFNMLGGGAGGNTPHPRQQKTSSSGFCRRFIISACRESCRAQPCKGSRQGPGTRDPEPPPWLPHFQPLPSPSFPSASCALAVPPVGLVENNARSFSAEACGHSRHRLCHFVRGLCPAEQLLPGPSRFWVAPSSPGAGPSAEAESSQGRPAALLSLGEASLQACFLPALQAYAGNFLMLKRRGTAG